MGRGGIVEEHLKDEVAKTIGVADIIRLGARKGLTESFFSKSRSEGANPECRDEAESGSCDKAGEAETLLRRFSLKNPILNR